MSTFVNLFHRKTPAELCKEWQRSIRKEERQLDRQLREIEREEKKIQREVKVLAKKGEMAAVRSLARELVRSKQAKERIHIAKAQMRSVGMSLRHQAATLKMASTFQKSTEMMQSMNKLMDVAKTNETLREMAMEMEKAGIIQEMMDDSLDSALDDDTLDDEIDLEVDKVVTELTMDVLNTAGTAPTSLPKQEIAETGKDLFRESFEEDAGTSALEKRLAALQS